MNSALERVYEEVVVGLSKFYPGNCCHGLRENVKELKAR
jgi:hypothetical protein